MCMERVKMERALGFCVREREEWECVVSFPEGEGTVEYLGYVRRKIRVVRRVWEGSRDFFLMAKRSNEKQWRGVCVVSWRLAERSYGGDPCEEKREGIMEGEQRSVNREFNEWRDLFPPFSLTVFLSLCTGQGEQMRMAPVLEGCELAQNRLKNPFR
ncbi:hypothetical protein COLO4_37752 [Corchorus olitorius]|uniref:Uncharacterized protein n=1 Tax=Corchorus olitorius TaxID=93759 RepID=A0A1R3FZJ7_9ROSI|nr:hypothetical protein COLO4_37752 [Corchorus olitorius]